MSLFKKLIKDFIGLCFYPPLSFREEPLIISKEISNNKVIEEARIAHNRYVIKMKNLGFKTQEQVNRFNRYYMINFAGGERRYWYSDN